MVSIVRRIINGRTYFYLEQSCRKEGRVEKKSLYLGKNVPRDIEKKKRDFMYQINKEQWFNQFEDIRENYVKFIEEMPQSSQAKERDQFSVRFTFNTQKIEGSTLSLNETTQLLEKGISPSQKPISDIREAEAHHSLFIEITNHKRDISLESVLQWHYRLFSSTKADIAGKIRTHEVRIAGSRFAPPMVLELDLLIGEFFDWYRKNKNKMNPVELAALCHLKFVTIHPFFDGNGRISRLMMNCILTRLNYPALDIEYRNRNSYYNALERSQMTGDEGIFCKWLFRTYVRQNRRYLHK